jgi:nitrite reductase/ring-hydroxylating ferredoxin subunit
VNEIESGRCLVVPVGGVGEIAICNAGGVYYATQSQCARDKTELSDATVVGTMIKCPSDEASFYLPTGECLYPAATRPLATYKVRIAGDDIQIDPVEALAKRELAGFGAPDLSMTALM